MKPEDFVRLDRMKPSMRFQAIACMSVEDRQRALERYPELRFDFPKTGAAREFYFKQGEEKAAKKISEARLDAKSEEKGASNNKKKKKQSAAAAHVMQDGEEKRSGLVRGDEEKEESEEEEGAGIEITHEDICSFFTLLVNKKNTSQKAMLSQRRAIAGIEQLLDAELSCDAKIQEALGGFGVSSERCLAVLCTCIETLQKYYQMLDDLKFEKILHAAKEEFLFVCYEWWKHYSKIWNFHGKKIEGYCNTLNKLKKNQLTPGECITELSKFVRDVADWSNKCHVSVFDKTPGEVLEELAGGFFKDPIDTTAFDTYVGKFNKLEADYKRLRDSNAMLIKYISEERSISSLKSNEKNCIKGMVKGMGCDEKELLSKYPGPDVNKFERQRETYYKNLIRDLDKIFALGDGLNVKKYVFGLLNPKKEVKKAKASPKAEMPKKAKPKMAAAAKNVPAACEVLADDNGVAVTTVGVIDEKSEAKAGFKSVGLERAEDTAKKLVRYRLSRLLGTPHYPDMHELFMRRIYNSADYSAGIDEKSATKEFVVQKGLDRLIVHTTNCALQKTGWFKKFEHNIGMKGKEDKYHMCFIECTDMLKNRPCYEEVYAEDACTIKSFPVTWVDTETLLRPGGLHRRSGSYGAQAEGQAVRRNGCLQLIIDTDTKTCFHYMFMESSDLDEKLLDLLGMVA